ncbi:peptidase domain-containing ABC transporter [Pseudomonas massiliensis]|uniref:peptidase domain-containing ABC transporter n=1 Tax=Pseudomonas massiliensis TaxID=522492 RepID=UPI00058C010E|nr:peptidase domain-containing ABC transporter [Pseudomonas massiliensis]
MNTRIAPQRPADPALWALVQVARHYRIAGCPLSLAHEHGSGGQPLTLGQLQHAARALGFHTHVQQGYRRLHRLPLPAIGYGRDQRPYVMWRRAQGRLWIQRMGDAEPFPVSRVGLASRSGGITLLLRPAPAQAPSSTSGFNWCWPTIRRYKHALARVLVAGICLLGFSLITPLFFQVVMDNVLVHRSLPTLAVMIIGLLGVILFESVFSAARHRLFAHSLARMDAELKAALFEHLLGLAPSFFSQRPVGEIAARMRELDTVRDFLTHHSLAVALDGLFSLVFLGVMLAYSPALTAVVAGSLVIYALLALCWGPVLRGQAEEAQARSADNQGFLVESLHGVSTLKGMAAERWTADQWDTRLTQAALAQRRMGLSAAYAHESIALTGKLVAAITLWCGAQAVMAGDLTVGSFIAFNLFASRVAQPALRLGQVWAHYQQAQVALRRLAVILQQPTQRRLGTLALPPLVGEVAVDSLCFRYSDDGPWVLDHLNFTIPSRQRVGITGTSGSGKSTLLNLLLGFAPLSKGTIRIDGHDIATADLASLRRQIGVVTQRPFLFQGTVHENIALALPGASRDEVMEAARQAGAHAFIERLPHGYDTLLVEAGGNLSGGQRQRISIARALLPNPPILFFDEATSALDDEAQAQLIAALPQIGHGRTLIMIAHRLETLRTCDRILVLDDGRLVEHGSPAELAGRPDGHYARLLRLQEAQA